jgi:hypothetical protein
MSASVAQRKTHKNDLEFDYDSWLKHVDHEAEQIKRDPHAYLKQEIQKNMKESLPKFLRFMV